MNSSYRSIWLSDVHLGTRSSRAAELLDFLAAVDADRIYLVGDIIDLKRMRTRPMFPKTHLTVITEFASLASNGTEVIFVPGNHDHQFRALAGQRLLGIQILPEAVHETPHGERWLVIHGDVLDGRIREGTKLERFGDCLYANDGDWVEHGTALAETTTGDLQILTWQTTEIVVEVIERRKLLAA